MIVVCPCTYRLRQETTVALAEISEVLAIPVHYEPMTEDRSYWALFHRLWHSGEPFLIVEHDIVPTVEQVRSLIECPEVFCAYGYEHEGDRTVALGCTKFGAPLFDNYLLQIPDWWAGERPPRWDEVDGWLHSILPPVHQHEGSVRHLKVGGRAYVS